MLMTGIGHGNYQYFLASVFFTESGFRQFAESGSGSRLLKFEEKEEENLSKKRPISLLKPLQRTLRLLEETSSLIENSSKRTILGLPGFDPVPLTHLNPDTNPDPNHFLASFQCTGNGTHRQRR
jgi:hypothetical protein